MQYVWEQHKVKGDVKGRAASEPVCFIRLFKSKPKTVSINMQEVLAPIASGCLSLAGHVVWVELYVVWVLFWADLLNMDCFEQRFRVDGRGFCGVFKPLCGVCFSLVNLSFPEFRVSVSIGNPLWWQTPHTQTQLLHTKVQQSTKTEEQQKLLQSY